jgi:inorganic triphosphatase YgiF
MATEVEAKLSADGPEPLRGLASLARLADAVLGPARTVAEVDRYLDTDDLRLAAARWACRLRRREGIVRVSLKGPAASESPADGLHRRPEVEGPATDTTNLADWPASEARTQLESLSAGRPLLERFRLVQQRTERSVRLTDGREVGLLSLDVADVVNGGRTLGRLHVVELELVTEGDEAPVAAITTALEALPGLAREPRTKLEHALELVDRA